MEKHRKIHHSEPFQKGDVVVMATGKRYLVTKHEDRSRTITSIQMLERLQKEEEERLRREEESPLPEDFFMEFIDRLINNRKK